MKQIYEDLRFLKDIVLFKMRGIFASRQELKKFKNIHKGERCFIVATGPSLTLEDVEALSNEYTFAVNSCFKIFTKTKWRPSYYVVTDPKFMEDMGEELKRYNNEIPCGFCSDAVDWTSPRINKFRPVSSYINLPKKGVIKYMSEIFKYNHMTNDITHGVISGHTVVFSVLQIAEYMGFDKIYLLGTDCNYEGKTQYSDLTSHVHINNPNAADLMIIDYLYAKRHFDKKDTTVYNATRGGKLEVFERVNLNEILSKAESVVGGK